MFNGSNGESWCTRGRGKVVYIHTWHELQISINYQVLTKNRRNTMNYMNHSPKFYQILWFIMMFSLKIVILSGYNMVLLAYHLPIGPWMSLPLSPRTSTGRASALWTVRGDSSRPSPARWSGRPATVGTGDL